MNSWGPFLKFRVPLLNDRQSFGISSRIIFLIWCIFGGFLLHFFGSLFLESLLIRDYEKPVDTAQDILDRGLSVITIPGGGSMVEILKNSPFPLTRRLAEMTVVPKVTLFYIYKNILTSSLQQGLFRLLTSYHHQHHPPYKHCFHCRASLSLRFNVFFFI